MTRKKFKIAPKKFFANNLKITFRTLKFITHFMLKVIGLATLGAVDDWPRTHGPRTRARAKGPGPKSWA